MGQHKSFDEIKLKISEALVLTFPKLKNPFKVETYAIGYVMGAIWMQGGKSVCYHSKMFQGGVLNYPTYDKEIYAIVQVVKKWNHYLMGKESMIFIDN
jgi:hypothetical protein